MKDGVCACVWGWGVGPTQPLSALSQGHPSTCPAHLATQPEGGPRPHPGSTHPGSSTQNRISQAWPEDGGHSGCEGDLCPLPFAHVCEPVCTHMCVWCVCTRRAQEGIRKATPGEPCRRRVAIRSRQTRTCRKSFPDGAAACCLACLGGASDAGSPGEANPELRMRGL